jgi:hypothetical protein
MKNQLKLARVGSLYHTKPPLCDLSDNDDLAKSLKIPFPVSDEALLNPER